MMYKTTVKIDGMACPMCESHVNEAIRNRMTVRKVTSSHKKGETVIISEDAFDTEKLKEVLCDTGYDVISAESVPYKKKGLFI